MLLSVPNADPEITSAVVASLVSHLYDAVMKLRGTRRSVSTSPQLQLALLRRILELLIVLLHLLKGIMVDGAS